MISVICFGCALIIARVPERDTDDNVTRQFVDAATTMVEAHAYTVHDNERIKVYVTDKVCVLPSAMAFSVN